MFGPHYHDEDATVLNRENIKLLFLAYFSLLKWQIGRFCEKKQKESVAEHSLNKTRRLIYARHVYSQEPS